MNLSLPYKKIIVEIVIYLYILLFVYAAMSKLLDFENFRIQIAQSPLLSAYAGLIAPGVIIAELLIVGLLALKNIRLPGLYASLFLMVAFTVYIYLILNYSEFVPCSCGGILEKMGWTQHLLFNIAFIILAILSIALIETSRVTALQVTFRCIITAVSATGIVILLFLFSEDMMRKENNFTRRFLQHPLTEEKILDLKFNSYYFAGFADGKIYLGNSTSPMVLTTIDTSLANRQQAIIALAGPPLKFHYPRLSVSGPNFFIHDGYIPAIYRGQLGDPLAMAVSKGDIPFSQLQPTGREKFALVAQSRREKANILGTLDLKRKQRSETNYSLLEKQVDGVFDTDGMLLFDHAANQLIYSYYYRNEFLVMDTDLKLLRKLHTIDTISRAQIRSARLKDGQHKLEAPPLRVNRNMAAHRQVLFVESNLMGKYESKEIWENASVIDIYKTNQQAYLGSLFVEHRGKSKMSQMLITDKYLFVLSGNELLRYRLALSVTKDFVQGEAEKPQ